MQLDSHGLQGRIVTTTSVCEIDPSSDRRRQRKRQAALGFHLGILQMIWFDEVEHVLNFLKVEPWSHLGAELTDHIHEGQHRVGHPPLGGQPACGRIKHTCRECKTHFNLR